MSSLGIDNPTPTAPIRVLVVDDEPEMCEFVARVLSDAGYRVKTAGDGPAAIASAELHGPPDLLLTDLKMPQMDGDEVAATLRQTTPDLKVLYLTGFSQALFTKRGTLWEGEAFLEKPCTPNALLEAVSLLLFNQLEAAGSRPKAADVRVLLTSLPKNPRRDPNSRFSDG